jgi:histidinol-phosphate phosphatase family protein
VRTAVFLDRDDTLMEANSLPPPPPPAKAGDVLDPALVRLLPGAAQACRILREAGLALVIFSNQGVIARGGATTATVDTINSRLLRLLHEAAPWDPGARGPLIERFYYCPWHPAGTVEPYNREHPWRKPSPGMILAAAADLKLDLSRSWVIGDAPRDIEAGIAAGIPSHRCIQIGPGTPYPTILEAARAITTRT